MDSFNMHFTQAQTTIEYTGFIEALHLKTSICTRIPIPKDRLAVFTNYPSVSKDQAPYSTLWFMAVFNLLVLGFNCLS